MDSAYGERLLETGREEGRESKKERGRKKEGREWERKEERARRKTRKRKGSRMTPWTCLAVMEWTGWFKFVSCWLRFPVPCL